MLNLILGISLIAILGFSIMGRMIYVLLRKLDDSDRWEQSLHSAIYKAGWMEDYKRAWPKNPTARLRKIHENSISYFYQHRTALRLSSKSGY